jgi:peroxiredoxin (alkyl hydroperoxide reductase subunit C)
MVTIGQKIADFEVDAFVHNSITKWKLSDQKNKWVVLMFYPADFTFVCPTELQEAQERYAEFKELGAEIASISTDTVYVHKAWHDASPAIGSIEYPMLADPAGFIARQFGTYIDAEGVALRGSFLIDPEGVLIAYEMHDNSIGRSAAEMLRRLQAAKYVREHKGEVCPASWKPGEKTLRPGLELVGKI